MEQNTGLLEQTKGTPKDANTSVSSSDTAEAAIDEVSLVKPATHRGGARRADIKRQKSASTSNSSAAAIARQNAAPASNLTCKRSRVEDDTEVSSKRGKTKTPEHPHAPPPALATAGGNKGPNTVSVAGPSMSDKSVDAAGQAGLRIAAPAVPPNTATGPATPQQLPARHAPRVFWQEHDFNETPRRSGVPVVHPSQSPFSPQQGTAAAQKHDQAHRGAMDNGKGKQPPTARRQLVVRTVVRRRGPCIVCAVGETVQWRLGPEGHPLMGQDMCNACGTRAARDCHRQSNRQANARTATKGSKHPHAAAVQAQSCSDLAAASAASREAAEGEDSLQQTTRNMIKRRTLWNALLAAGQQLWDLLPAEQQVQHLNPEASSSEEDVPADSALHTLAAAAEQCADLEMTAAASAASEKPPSKKRQRGDDEDQTVEPTNKQGRLIIKDVNKQ